MKTKLGRFVQLLLVIAVTLGCANQLPAQTLIKLFTNGPAANRINLVFLAEGYRTVESNKFITDATAMVGNLMAATPYAEYTNYFNAYAIFVASTNSGANHSPYGSPNTNNSYFSSSFNSYNSPQLLTIPPNDRTNNYNLGHGKIVNLLTNLLPEYDYPILLVNDSAYGGSSLTPETPFPFLLVSLSAQYGAGELIVHESGHLIGGLADEYSSGSSEITNLMERPNATTNTTPALIPWNLWFDEGIPIPTPNEWGGGSIGAFLGAQYHTNLWYRPTLGQCVMNSPLNTVGGIPAYCPVCAEAVTRGFYSKIRAIDTFSPATNNNNLTLTLTNAIAFTAIRLQPTTHNLDLQWFTNSVAVPNATNAAFTLLPQNLPNGSYTVRAQALDATTLVRNDPNNSLSNSVLWNVTVARSSLQLILPQWLPSGQFSCVVTGVALNGFVIQSSTNFVNWTPLATNVLTGGMFNFTNNPAGLTSRFYRALAN